MGNFIHIYAKLEFPRYDGNEDQFPWLSCCNYFFCHFKIPEEEKMVAPHLEHDA